MPSKRKKKTEEAQQAKVEGKEEKELEAEELKKKLEETSKRAEDLFSRLQYLQADFENYKKRVERDKEAFVKFANEELIVKLLPVIDDFERALTSLKDEEAKGMKMIFDNLMKSLKEEGLEEIPALGQDFDPYKHEVAEQINDDNLGENKIARVVQKGYFFNLKVIRPSKVVVARKGAVVNG